VVEVVEEIVADDGSPARQVSAGINGPRVVAYRRDMVKLVELKEVIWWLGSQRTQ
jgi:hypothetical protein